MFEWANKFFRRKEAPPQPAPAPLPAYTPPPARRGYPRLPYFFEYVTKLGFEDFFSTEENNQPHLLQAETMKRDNYLHRFSMVVHDILRHAYEDSDSYSRGPDYTWKRLYPDVAEFIRAQEPATAAAFETLLSFCKQYSRSVAEMPIDPGANCRIITAAKNGFSNEETAQVKDALGKIWKAVPDCDPHVVEGFRYVMESTPAVADAFDDSWWGKNDRRSDYRIAEKLEKKTLGWDGPSAVEAAAIARQTADNLAALKPHAGEIAKRTLAWCLSRTLDIDDDWRCLGGSREAAGDILGALGRGADIAEQAEAVKGGRYGPLSGKSEGGADDRLRQRALKSVAAAPAFIALAQEINSGAWFDAQRTRLLELADELLWTPEVRAQKEQERHDRMVESVAAGATVLQSSVRVKNALRLKPHNAGR